MTFKNTPLFLLQLALCWLLVQIRPDNELLFKRINLSVAYILKDLREQNVNLASLLFILKVVVNLNFFLNTIASAARDTEIASASLLHFP
jgi:hypothetical protein